MKEVIKLVEEFNGVVLAIGINEKISNAINKNKNIIKCDVLNYVSNKKEEKLARAKRLKTISIKKIRKIYKKKKVDYIICEYSQIEKYLNTFVRDSVYINSNKLFFYGEVNDELILKKYKRYTSLIKVTKKNKNCIIEIDNTNTKNNIFKEFIYKIVDGANNVIEFIGDVMMG